RGGEKGRAGEGATRRRGDERRGDAETIGGDFSMNKESLSKRIVRTASMIVQTASMIVRAASTTIRRAASMIRRAASMTIGRAASTRIRRAASIIRRAPSMKVGPVASTTFARAASKTIVRAAVIAIAATSIVAASYIAAQKTSPQRRGAAARGSSSRTRNARARARTEASPAPFRAKDPNRAPQKLVDDALYTTEDFFGSPTQVARPYRDALAHISSVINQYPKDQILRYRASILAEYLGDNDRSAKEMVEYADLKGRSPNALRL